MIFRMEKTVPNTGQFSDIEIFAKTLWGEARNQGYEGQQAVASVILNRVKLNGWRGHDIRSVCLKPFQFSCWLQSDPNRPKLMEVTTKDPIYTQCIGIAGNAAVGALPDNTNGGTSYYAKSMPYPPNWASGQHPCAEIGDHLFFKV